MCPLCSSKTRVSHYARWDIELGVWVIVWGLGIILSGVLSCLIPYTLRQQKLIRDMNTSREEFQKEVMRDARKEAEFARELAQVDEERRLQDHFYRTALQELELEMQEWRAEDGLDDDLWTLHPPTFVGPENDGPFIS